MAYQNSLVLKFNGLYLGPNTLASTPTGALEIADNIDIADDVAYSRRGNAAYGTSLGSNQAKQLFSYKDRLLVHSGNTLSYDNVKLEITSLTSLGIIATAVTSSAHGLITGQEVTITGCDQVEYNVINTPITYINPTSFSYPITNITISPATTHSITYLESGVWSPNAGLITEPVSGTKVKSVELNGNLYLTSSEGIKKLTDPTAALGSAGIPQGLTLIGTLNSDPGFFEQDNQVSYVVVWGLKDANKNLLLGTPSQAETLVCSATSLFSKDFTKLLIKLDNDALAVPLVNPIDFASTLTFTEDVSKADVYTKMTELGNKLDLVLKNYGDIVSVSASATTSFTAVGIVSPYTITAAGHTLLPGDRISISGFTGTSTPSLNGFWTVNTVAVGSFTIVGSPNVTVTGSGTISELPIITSTAHGLANLEVVNISDTTSNPTLTGTFIVKNVGTNTFKITADIITTTSGAGGTWKKNTQFYGTETGGLMNLTDFPDTSSISTIQNTFEKVLAKLDSDSKITDTDYSIEISTTRSQTVDLTIIIPSGITTSHFYQIYRSSLSADVDTTPNADYKQVYEANPTTADLTLGSITLQDITTDIFRSNPLYSSDSQEGSTQTNDVPPFAKDIALYKDSVFYANTSTRHFYETSLVGTSNLGSHISYLDSLAINTITHTPGINTITFVMPPNLSLSQIDPTKSNYRLKIEGATNSSNNGIFTIVSVDSTTYTIVVNNPSGVSEGLNTTTACSIIGDTITLDGISYEFREGVPTVDKLSVNTVAGGEWFSFYNGDNSRKYLIWYKVNGFGSAPGVPETDSIKIQVTLGAGPTAVQVATATQIAIDAITNDFVNVTTATSSPNNQYSIPGINAVIGGTSVYIVPKTNGLNNTIVLSPSLAGIFSNIRIRSGYEGERSVASSGTITLINGSPATITSVGHGLSAGNIVTIAGSNSSPNIDGTYYIQTATPTQFSLKNGATILTPGTLGTWSTPKYVGKSSSTSVGNAVTETAKSIVKLLNLDTINDVIGIYNSSVEDIPGKLLFKRENITDPSFNISSTNAISFSPDLSLLPVQVSDNEVLGNRIYYSKMLQAEAVPSLNFINIGSRELPILRVLALRDSLFVFKRDGIYRVTGDAFSLQVSLFDSSAKLVAPESAVVGNNQIFCFTDQGVVAVSDTGVAIVSGAIEKILVPFYSQTFLDLITNHTFATFYTTDRKYILWLPESTEDLTATQAYVYNTLNNVWTRYPIAKTCALVNIVDDKLYLGSAEDNYIEQERKSFTYKDQADRRLIRTIVEPNVTTNLTITNIALGKPSTITVNIPHNLSNGDYVVINNSNSIPSINGTYKVFNVKNSNQFSISCNRVTTLGTSGQVTKLTSKVQLDSVNKVNIGDVLVQPFFLNVNRFNLLLGKLDLDTGLNDEDYLELLKVTTREEIPQAIVDLAAKLTIDTGNTYTASLESDIRKIQYQFNKIIETLNSDSVVNDTNYTLSDNDLTREVGIIDVNLDDETVTTAFAADLSAGECFIYKAIETKIQWIPQHAGDASIEKQHTEAQVMFNELSCSSMSLGFKTETSPYTEEVEIKGQGSAAFGYSLWGVKPFGLNTLSDNLRTLVPSEKQRGRFIIPSILHNKAYETYGATGLAIVFRTIAYKVNN